MSKHTPKPVAPVTAATMPHTYTVDSVVDIPTLKERATKAHILATQALGCFALAHAIDPNGSMEGTEEIERSLRAFCGFNLDARDLQEAGGHALLACVEELYVVVDHPDADAIESIRVPTREDWEHFQRVAAEGGAQ